TFDAFALKSGVRLIQVEINEKLLLHRLWVVVEERRHIRITTKKPKGVPVDEVGGSRSQADHASVEVLDDLGKAPKERAMSFVEDDDIEKTWTEPRVAERHCLLGGDKETLCFVDLTGVNPIARLVR